MGTAIRIAVGLALIAVLATAGTGCKKLKHGLGFSTHVSEAEPGSPEATIQTAIKAAMQADETTGWRQFEPLIHSNQKGSPAAVREWRELRFTRMRKQWKNFVTEGGVAEFDVGRERELEDGTLEIYIDSKTAELPTPCAVKKDTDGAWRITRCSL